MLIKGLLVANIGQEYSQYLCLGHIVVFQYVVGLKVRIDFTYDSTVFTMRRSSLVYTNSTQCKSAVGACTYQLCMHWEMFLNPNYCVPEKTNFCNGHKNCCMFKTVIFEENFMNSRTLTPIVYTDLPWPSFQTVFQILCLWYLYNRG